jgi:hypothetical protein
VIGDEKCPRCGGNAQLVPARPAPLLLCRQNPSHVSIAKVAKSKLPLEAKLSHVQPPKRERPIRQVVVRGDES